MGPRGASAAPLWPAVLGAVVLTSCSDEVDLAAPLAPDLSLTTDGNAVPRSDAGGRPDARPDALAPDRSLSPDGNTVSRSDAGGRPDARPDALAPDRSLTPDGNTVSRSDAGGRPDARPDAPAPDRSLSPDGNTVPRSDAGEGPDARPNPDGLPSSSVGCVQGSFRAYYGDLHNHTGFSDGKCDTAKIPPGYSCDPQYAFKVARDNHLDVLFVTDHAVMITPQDWQKCRAQADQANVKGSFVAECGYELQIRSPTADHPANTAHTNVFYNPEYLPFVATPDVPCYFSQLAQCSTCLAQFNHPGPRLTTRPPDLMAWFDLQWRPEADMQMALFELNGGTVGKLGETLNEGWHVSPSLNSDTHWSDWGRYPFATGLWLDELSRDAVKRAIRERRTFSTFDRKATIKLLANGSCWMGSRLTATKAVPVRVELTRGGYHGKLQLQLLQAGVQLLEIKRIDCPGATCTLEVTLALPLPRFVFAVAIDPDAAYYPDQAVLVSAPVWFES